MNIINCPKNDILKIMKLHSNNIEDHERLAVLTFERVNVLDVSESDVNHDNSVDTYIELQVVMV